MINRNYKIALLGAGNWGKNYIRVLHKLGVLVAIIDPQETIREKYSREYPKLLISDDYRKVLENPTIDGVIVATSAYTHYEVTKYALLHGKDVLVEKPMALCVSEALEMKELADKNNRILMVGHLLLYKPAVQKIVEYTQQKVIGEIRTIDMQRLKLGKVRSQENVLWSFAPHDLAVLSAIIKSSINNITVKGQSMVQTDIEDDIYLHIDFDNKSKAHIHISWLWPYDERKTTIVGTKGMIVYDEKNNKLQIYRKGIRKDLSIWEDGIEEIVFEDIDVLEKQVLHFLDCMDNRSEPITNSNSGIEVIRILEAATKLLDTETKAPEFYRHESAVVDDPMKIGSGTQIWHFSHIMSGAEIGQNCKLGQNVFVANGAIIGNRVKLQNNISIYEGVILEDDVFCGPSMVFTNIKTPRSQFPRNTADDYAITRVKKGASIGANATIVCGIQIGEHALIGAGSVVTKDVPDHAIVYGNPARQKGWICRCGETIIGIDEAMLKCDACGTERKV